jgi:hypothetical protein
VYKIRRTYETIDERGSAKKVAELVYKQAKVYRDAGQRNDFTVSYNSGTLPGEKNIVILEWTADKIISPGRPDNTVPPEAIEIAMKYRPMVEDDYIEFFEMIDPERMNDGK